MSMLVRLFYLRPLVGWDEYSAWEEMAKQRQIPELFERLMV